MASWALHYATLGLRVFPVKPDSSTPAIKGWPEKATTDPRIIAGWWRTWPSAGIGMLTGANGLVVVDADVKNDPQYVSGYQSLIVFTDAHPEVAEAFEASLLVYSRSGGAHHIWRTDKTVHTHKPWLYDVDLIASGNHFIVVPPTSRTFEGRESRYRLVRGDFASIPEASDELLEALRQGRSKSTGSAGSTPERGTSNLPKTDYLKEHGFRGGERDAGFHALAWRLVRTHWPHVDLVRQIAFDVWDASDQGADPYPWAFVESKIERAIAALEPQIIAEREITLRWAEGLRSSND